MTARLTTRLLFAAAAAVGLATTGCGEAREAGRGGSWRLAAPMLQPRVWHGAVVLRTGEVLVMGGTAEWSDGASARVLASAELYDPVTGTWRETGPMATPRSDPSPVLLDDGRVLVAGGSTEVRPCTWQGNAGICPIATASAEIYDPVSGEWSTTSPMRFPRRCGMVRLADGRYLKPCGWFDHAADLGGPELEAFDPAAGAWEEAGTLPAAEGDLAALLPSGDVLVVGGIGTPAEASRRVFIHEPATMSTRELAPMPHGVFNATLTPLPSGELLLAGGCRSYYFACSVPGDPLEARLFDPATETWSPKGTLLMPRSYAGAIALPSGRVLIVGGDYSEAFRTAGPAEVYDPSTGASSLTPPLPHFVGNAGALVVLASGEVLHTGGQIFYELDLGNPSLVAISAAQIYRE